MFRGDVQWKREAGSLTGDTADVDYTFWVGGGSLADLAIGWWVQPARDGELGGADGVSDVDVEDTVVA